LHLHGQLASPMPSAVQAQHEFEPDDAKAPEWIMASVASIRLVQEEIDTDIVDLARRWIQDAARVCFLGCGYHRFTLSRLGVPDILVGKMVHGTTYQMPAGPRSVLKDRFGSVEISLQEPGVSVADFLRSDSLIHH